MSTPTLVIFDPIVTFLMVLAVTALWSIAVCLVKRDIGGK